MTPADFILANTRLAVPPFVPEVSLYLSGDPFGLWRAMERELGRPGPTLPFWGFAWPGGLALARYVLDHPELVRDRRVVDLASGSGLVAVAAALAGAAEVAPSEIDPYGVAAIGLNAAANGVTLAPTLGDLLDGDRADAEVLLAGDVFYEQPFTERVAPFLARVRAAGTTVLVGEPERNYLPQSLPRERFEPLATYDVPLIAGLEDETVKRTAVWRAR